MADRQLTFTAARTRPDGTADVNLVRITITANPITQIVSIAWECGRVVAGVWTPSTETGTHALPNTDWATYLAEGAALANQHEAQQDWCLQKLIDAGIVGAGTKGPY